MTSYNVRPGGGLESAERIRHAQAAIDLIQNLRRTYTTEQLGPDKDVLDNVMLSKMHMHVHSFYLFEAMKYRVSNRALADSYMTKGTQELLYAVACDESNNTTSPRRQWTTSWPCMMMLNSPQER
eukprot:TRINITY_DN8719_c0_g1_i2.p1 TRINITY_DN8719_c0_g1~~TRINITY_DN8719_c0_g1_i2.p1  ORF type:complete len:125 (-),score=31.08 TRINITY_DN8719_c0_g1_i2:316-690(-)